MRGSQTVLLSTSVDTKARTKSHVLVIIPPQRPFGCVRVRVSARAQTSQSRKTVTATPYKAAELAHCVHTQFANHSNALLDVCTV